MAESKGVSGILIVDFNSEFRKYISQKKLTKAEIANKTRRLKKLIEDSKKNIKKLGYEKSRITHLANHEKINYLVAAKQYKILTGNQNIKKINIKEFEQQINSLKKDKDTKIEILGIFSRTFVKKSYFLSLKNPAEYMIRIDLKEAKKIVANQAYKISYGKKQRYGIEAQLERLKINLNELLGYDEEEVESEKEYPIEVVITPIKIMFL